MPSLSTLPTETLCEIFKFVTGGVDGGILDPTVAAQNGCGIPTQGMVAPSPEAFKLPELTSNILSALTLSHVCRKWGKIMLDRPAMWQRVRISYRQIFLRRHLADISAEVLARSRSYPLHLDVSLLGCDVNSKEDCEHMYKLARRLFTDVHLARCESLRIEGRHWPVHYFLSMFKRYNSRAYKFDLDPTRIRWLHIIEDASQGNIGPAPSFRIGLIAPLLTSLNAQFAVVANFPRWMDRIIFEDRLYSRETYWDALTISQAKHIILSDVRIPAPRFYQPGQHQAQQNIADRAAYLARTGSRLVSIMFHALRDSTRNIDFREGMRGAHQLFEETFLERVSSTLEEVRFVEITGYTWAGFVSACKGLQFDFPRVHTLRLEKVDIRVGDDDFVLLGRIFPNLTRLMVEGMDDLHGANLMRIWEGDRSVWPELREMGYGGVLVDRNAVLEFKTRRSIPRHTMSYEV